MHGSWAAIMKPSVSDLRPGVLSQFLWVFDADIVGISQIILFYFIYLFIFFTKNTCHLYSFVNTLKQISVCPYH